MRVRVRVRVSRSSAWQKSRWRTSPEPSSSHARKSSTSRSVCGTRICASWPGEGRSTTAVGEEGEAGPPLPPVAVGEARLGDEMLGSRTGCGFAGEVMRCRGGDTEGGDTGGGGDRRPRWPSGMGGLRKWSLGGDFFRTLCGYCVDRLSAEVASCRRMLPAALGGELPALGGGCTSTAMRAMASSLALVRSGLGLGLVLGLGLGLG